MDGTASYCTECPQVWNIGNFIKSQKSEKSPGWWRRLEKTNLHWNSCQKIFILSSTLANCQCEKSGNVRHFCQEKSGKVPSSFPQGFIPIKFWKFVSSTYTRKVFWNCHWFKSCGNILQVNGFDEMQVLLCKISRPVKVSLRHTKACHGTMQYLLVVSFELKAMSMKISNLISIFFPPDFLVAKRNWTKTWRCDPWKKSSWIASGCVWQNNSSSRWWSDRIPRQESNGCTCILSIINEEPSTCHFYTSKFRIFIFSV